MKTKITLIAELQFTADQLRHWITVNCPDRMELRNWTQRWKTTPLALERFLNGTPNSLTAETIATMSRDTELSIKQLMLIGATGNKTQQVELEPIITGNKVATPVKILVMPKAVGVYKGGDFRGNEIWLRTMEDYTLTDDPYVQAWFKTGLKILDHKMFMAEFHPALRGHIFGKWQIVGKGFLTFSLLNLSQKYVIMKAGQRVGVLRLGIKEDLANYIYEVPKKYGHAAEEV